MDKLLNTELMQLAIQKGFLSKDKLIEVYQSYYYLWMCELQRWLRNKYFIYVNLNREVTGSDEWEFSYSIEYLPTSKQNAKRRSIEFKIIDSYFENGGVYRGAWSDDEKALESGLLMALKLSDITFNDNYVK